MTFEAFVKTLTEWIALKAAIKMTKSKKYKREYQKKAFSDSWEIRKHFKERARGDN